MRTKFSHSQNVLESTFATVTSGGHWFHATRQMVDTFVPGLLKRQDYEKLIMDAVNWIESAESLSLILYFALVFFIPAWIAAALTIGFYLWWYYSKSAFVNIPMTPLLKILNHDAFQIGLAAIALSFLGIIENYWGVFYGVVFFFLFKVGLMRILMKRVEGRRQNRGLPLNDRVFKMVLIRYSIYEDLQPPQVSQMEDSLKEAVLKFKEKGSWKGKGGRKKKD